MSSITTWSRIEPRVRDASLPGMDARLADPLWLLGRQWQVGEFHGEDAGSPAAAALDAGVGTLSRFAAGVPAGAQLGIAFDPAEIPLEALAEREPVLQAGERNIRLAVESGLAWWRILDELGLDHRREDYLLESPLPRLLPDDRAGLDEATQRLADLFAERVPDGVALRASFFRVRAAGGDLPASPRYDDIEDRKLAVKAVDRYLSWWDALDAGAGSAATCWAGDRLEYRFGASGRVDGRERVLVAPAYFGEGLDWSSFDVDTTGATLMSGASDPDSTTLSFSAMPSPATYRGMPAPRWWEFEDADVHFGAADAGPEDLSRMLFMEFALVYGNDFFVLPVDLEVGSLCVTHSLVVTDTFGGRWSIPSQAKADGPNREFRLFELTGGEGIFLAAPGLATGASGPPLEEVAFLRDEMADMAWAVERTVTGPGGIPIRRQETEAELAQRRRQEAIEEGTATPKRSDDPLHYRLADLPPGNWMPLVPVKTGTDQIDLQLRSLLSDESPPRLLEPQGRILEQGSVFREEEVARTGVTVRRAYQSARWRGGASLLWIGRSRHFGNEQGSSGLRYDVAE